MKFTENSTSRIAAEAQSLLNEIASLPEMKLSAVSKKSAMAVFMDIVNGFIREGAMRYFPGRKGGVDLRETPSDKSEDRE